MTLNKKLVWVKDPIGDCGFIQMNDEGGGIVSFIDNDKHQFPASHTYPVNPESNYQDATLMLHLHEPGLLDLLKTRFLSDNIYTFIAFILVSVNPYKTLPFLYSDTKRESYRGKAIGVLPPHIYALADRSFRLLKSEKKNQVIIMSGESGAGKTECSKIIIQYFTSATSNNDSTLLNQIVFSNYILEAFGNAKTRRNNNSSRFGKLVSIEFDSVTYKICGAKINTYLLETSRVVCAPMVGEQNYHIFYHICQGRNFKICGCGSGGLTTDFSKLEKAFELFNINSKDVYDVIEMILHLSALEFKSKGGDLLEIVSSDSLNYVIKVLGPEIVNIMTTRVITTRSEKTIIPLTIEQAEACRDGLMKSIYSKLFDWLVLQINSKLSSITTTSTHQISILDIYGFEFFDVNSLEQLFINYANERLQQHFNQQVFRQELVIYEKEGIKCEPIHFIDNSECIDMIDSIFVLLEDEDKTPKKSDKGFTSKVHKNLSKSSHISVPKLSTQQKLLNDEAFVIKHYAGSVCYDTRTHFVAKNNDMISSEINNVIATSATLELLKILYPLQKKTVTKAAVASNLLSKKFHTQLSELFVVLNNSSSHFIRCINPNDHQTPGLFIGDKVLTQMKSLGLFDTLKVLHQGFPTRASYDQIYNRFKDIMPESIRKLDNVSFAKVLFMAMDFSPKDFQLGITKIFFRAGKLAFLDDLKSSDYLESAPHIMQKIKGWIIKQKFKSAFYQIKAGFRLIKFYKSLETCKKFKRNVNIIIHIQKTFFHFLVKIRQKRKQIILIQSLIRRFLVLKKYKKICYVDDTKNDIVTTGNNNSSVGNSCSPVIINNELLQSLIQRIQILEKQVESLMKTQSVKKSHAPPPPPVKPIITHKPPPPPPNFNILLDKMAEPLREALNEIHTFFKHNPIGEEKQPFNNQIIRKSFISALVVCLGCGFKNWGKMNNQRYHLYNFYEDIANISSDPSSIIKTVVTLINEKTKENLVDLDLKFRMLIIYLLNQNRISDIIRDVLKSEKKIDTFPIIKQWFEPYSIFYHHDSIKLYISLLQSLENYKYNLNFEYELSSD
jgi:myosin heavy subunit